MAETATVRAEPRPAFVQAGCAVRHREKTPSKCQRHTRARRYVRTWRLGMEVAGNGGQNMVDNEQRVCNSQETQVVNNEVEDEWSGRNVWLVILRRIFVLTTISLVFHVVFPQYAHISTAGHLLPFGDGDFQFADAMGLTSFVALVRPFLRVLHKICVKLKLTEENYASSFATLEPIMFWLGILLSWLVFFDGIYTVLCPANPTSRFCRLLPNQLTSISTALYLVLVINFLKRVALRSLDRKGIQRRKRAEYVMVEKAFTVLTVMSLITFTAFKIGISVKTILTYGGFSTLAIGFAAQHVIKDIYAGFMIYLFKPFVSGDNVRLPSYDKGGLMRVMDIGWIQTELRLWDSSLIVVPNSQLFGNMIINRTLKQYAYINEVVHIRYSDLPRIERLLESLREYLQNRSEVASDTMPPLVFVEKLDSSYVDVRFMIWLINVPTRTRLQIMSSLLIGLALRIREEGCDFAFPRLEIMSESQEEQGPSSEDLKSDRYRKSLISRLQDN